MNAEQFLSLAEALRSYAHHSGRDTNAASHFVHSMLMRAIHMQTDACDKPAAIMAEQDVKAA
ncbi:MAG: hypothetical protein ABL883_06305 [Terricaulis sp.]